MSTSNTTPLSDTIAAIATAPGEAGISIVRLSGPESIAIADRVFRNQGPRPSERGQRALVFGCLIDNSEVIDQALMLIMRAPNSYTGEDVVEFQGHGGHLCARRMLRCVLDAGARLAGPGEFTQRAFLNGRMDLVQAEAVLDLIRARSDRAATAALAQMDGQLSRDFNVLYDETLEVTADIEATLDFPEDELPDYVLPDIIKRLHQIQSHMNQLLATWDEGHLLRDGAMIVISGKPNVGKSTMLNALLGRDRAIVSSTPGTTRDTIEEDMTINGIPVRLIDTAGLRATECEIEQVGIQRARSRMEQADLHIYVVDASQPLDETDLQHIESLPPDRYLVVLNKIDLGNAVGDQLKAYRHVLHTSLLQPGASNQIRDAVAQLFAQRLDLSARPHATISERHRTLLRHAFDELQAASTLLHRDTDSESSSAPAHGEDFAPLASDRVRTALEHLGEVTGRVYHEELLNSIFSRFCIGK